MFLQEHAPNIAVQQTLPQEQTASSFCSGSILVSADNWPPQLKEVCTVCLQCLLHSSVQCTYIDVLCAHST